MQNNHREVCSARPPRGVPRTSTERRAVQNNHRDVCCAPPHRDVPQQQHREGAAYGHAGCAVCCVHNHTEIPQCTATQRVCGAWPHRECVATQYVRCAAHGHTARECAGTATHPASVPCTTTQRVRDARPHSACTVSRGEVGSADGTQRCAAHHHTETQLDSLTRQPNRGPGPAGKPCPERQEQSLDFSLDHAQ